MTEPDWRLLAGLSGLIPEDEGRELARLAALVPSTTPIVEIGSFKGKSTCYLATGAKMGLGAHVFAVEPWDAPGNVYGKHGFTDPKVKQEFYKQIYMAGVRFGITAIQGFGAEVGKRWGDLYGYQVGMLFIDGDHSEAAVQADLDAWLPHMQGAGIIAFDDFGTPRNPGVRKVVDRYSKRSRLPYEVLAGRLAVFHR